MQINFRNTLVNQNDLKLAKIFSISQKEIKDRNDDNVENYSRPIEELKYFLTKDYARTYINLKNRNRYNVMDYVRQFKKTLQELKILVDEELAIS
jgi:prephenate dehydrogenase